MHSTRKVWNPSDTQKCSKIFYISLFKGNPAASHHFLANMPGCTSPFSEMGLCTRHCLRATWFAFGTDFHLFFLVLHHMPRNRAQLLFAFLSQRAQQSVLLAFSFEHTPFHAIVLVAKDTLHQNNGRRLKHLVAILCESCAKDASDLGLGTLSTTTSLFLCRTSNLRQQPNRFVLNNSVHRQSAWSSTTPCSIVP